MRLRLEQVGGSPAAVEAVAERVTKRAQGNPFYIEELLTYLTERGGELPSVEELERLELPGSLHSLILSRMDRLEETPRATLKVASAVGRSFEAPVLPAVHPELGSDEAVESSLENLRGHEFVLVESEELRSYEFRHVVTQEVAYGSLPGATRAALHGRIGRFLEARAGDEIERELDVLAHHFWLGDDEERKRSYLVRAGAAAQARYANAAAITYYRRVLPLLEGEERADVLLKLGKALELGGRWQESQETYLAGLTLAEELEGAGDSGLVRDVARRARPQAGPVRRGSRAARPRAGGLRRGSRLKRAPARCSTTRERSPRSRATTRSPARATNRASSCAARSVTATTWRASSPTWGSSPSTKRPTTTRAGSTRRRSPCGRSSTTVGRWRSR